MARIKIKDLPKDRKISKEELKKVRGGALIGPSLNILESTDQDHKDWIAIQSFLSPIR